MSTENQAPAQQQQQIPVQVRYEKMEAKYANHALVNQGGEEIYIEFSSGIVTDPGAGVAVMPIHTRLAMTPSAVVRLYQLLGQTVQNFRVVQLGNQNQQQQPAAEAAPAGEAQS